METPKTTLKQLKIAPKGTDKKITIPANSEITSKFQALQEKLQSLERVEMEKVKARLACNNQLRKISQEMSENILQEALSGNLDELAGMIRKVDSKQVGVGDKVLKLIEEMRKRSFKLSASDKLSKIYEKFPNVVAFIERTEAQGQGKAGSDEIKELIVFPKI